MKTTLIIIRGDYFWFGSVFIKKTKQILKKTWNRFKPTGFGSVWFFMTKTGSNRFGSVFQFGSVFFRFGSVFFNLGSVQFFRFQTYKTETEPNRLFFQNFNRFFSRFGFFRFSRFNRFFSFFSHPLPCFIVP